MLKRSSGCFHKTQDIKWVCGECGEVGEKVTDLELALSGYLPASMERIMEHYDSEDGGVKPCPFCGEFPKPVDRKGKEVGFLPSDWLVKHKRGCVFVILTGENVWVMDKRQLKYWNRRQG